MTANETSPNTDADLEQGFGDDNTEVVKPTLQVNPRLVWFTGNLSTTNFKTPVGWHVPAEVNPRLDKILTAMGIERYTVQHKSGEVRQVPWWNLSAEGRPISLIIVAHGVLSTFEMKDHPEERTGIAYGVGIAKDRDGNVEISEKTHEPKQKPQLQLRAFIHELLAQGFTEWFQVSLTNYIVDDMLKALNVQFRVIDVYDSSMQAKGSPSRGKFWGFSLPMVPAAEPREVGKGPLTSTIFPMVAQVPQLRVGDPGTLDYLRNHRIPMDLQQRLCDGLLDETAVWSIDRSIEIIEGKEQDQLPAAVTVSEESVDATAVVVPEPSEDRPVNTEELNWITKVYCMNNKSIVQQLCGRFGVGDAAQLRKVHYDTLRAESASYSS